MNEIATIEFCKFEIRENFLVCAKCESTLRYREGKPLPKRICGKVDPEKFASQQGEIRDRILFDRTIPVAKIECQHRGQALSRLDCPPCQSGGADTTLYGCKIHVECTLQNLAVRKKDGSRYRACATCEDRQESDLTPPPAGS